MILVNEKVKKMKVKNLFNLYFMYCYKLCTPIKYLQNNAGVSNTAIRENGPCQWDHYDGQSMHDASCGIHIKNN